MGLGKTLQTVAFLHTYHATYPTQRSLLVVPSNVLTNWEREFQQWLPAFNSAGGTSSSLTFDKASYLFDISIILHLNQIVYSVKAVVWQTCLIREECIIELA